MERKNVLIIVPHQDDELNLIGPLIPSLKKLDFCINVLFTTNGNISANKNTRYKEAKSVARLLGIDSISYLGYPDSGPNIGRNNIYNSNDFDNKQENNGHQYTSGVKGKNEFCYEKHKKHNLVTRANMLGDLEEYILEVNPYVVFCVDYDKHTDHRIASLLTDEAMKEVGRKIKPTPLYFKGFCYLGCWLGSNDYFSIIPKPTLNEIGGVVVEPTPYSWEKRIMLSVEPRFFNVFYWRSLLYKAYKKYKSQKAHKYFFRCLNTDKVFWKRDLTNVCYDSKLSATSGEVLYLNDGKLIDSNNVGEGIFGRELEKTWSPNKYDKQKTITIFLPKQTRVLRGLIYFALQPKHDLKISIKYNDIVQRCFTKNNTFEFKIDDKEVFQSVAISFESETNQQIFISELELFDSEVQEERFGSFLKAMPTHTFKKRKKRAICIVLFVDKIKRFFRRLFRVFVRFINTILETHKSKKEIILTIKPYFSYLENGLYVIDCSSHIIYKRTQKSTFYLENKNTYDGSINNVSNMGVIRRALFFIKNNRFLIVNNKRSTHNYVLGIITSHRDVVKLFDYKNKCVLSFYKNIEKRDKVLINRSILLKIGFRLPRLLKTDCDYVNKCGIFEELITKNYYSLESGVLSYLNKYNLFKPIIINYDKNIIDKNSNIINLFLLSNSLEKESGLLNNLSWKELFSFAICHGDFYPMNYIFDGINFYLIDYENLGTHVFYYDLIMFICQSYLFLNNDSIIKSYLEGKYDSEFYCFFEKNHSVYHKEARFLYVIIAIFEHYNYEMSEGFAFTVSRLLSLKNSSDN